MSFIQGTLAPFGHIPFLVQGPSPSQNSFHAVDKKTGFDRDAENLHQDWVNVGNYINDAISNHEQQSTDEER